MTSRRHTRPHPHIVAVYALFKSRVSPALVADSFVLVANDNGVAL